MFIGRTEQLVRLEKFLRRVREADDDRPGRALLLRGRRRVGKSRLVEEFVERSDVPHVYFAATGRPPVQELALFAQEVAASSLPGADLFQGNQPESWDAALRLLAAALPNGPSIVVLDEIPYLIASDPHFEGTLQRAFDRELSRRRVLLVGIGSDLSMMEALGEYGRPFHQRASEMVIPPFTPAEVGDMLDLDPADAVDATVVTGGLPLICGEWPVGVSLSDYLDEAIHDPTSALIVSGERSLAAEFPAEVQARRVLSVVGAGERTFSAIGRQLDGVREAALDRSLKLLRSKRVVAVDRPLSTRTGHETRYRVADPYLRFWLRFIGPHLEEIERGRADRVLARLRGSWTGWRGRAVEPVVRDAIGRLDPSDLGVGEHAAWTVGSYWTRRNDPEIDLVIGDREPVARRVLALGSVKWKENRAFDARDLAALMVHRSQLPGASDSTPLVVVSRSGCDVDGVIALGPEDLVGAYR
jgi:AAA+ ATPase superfamily predicted ATPase